jgi:cell division protein FtsB
MKSFMENRHIIRQNLIAIIGGCLSVYFCYHLMAGERSYFRLLSHKQHIEQAQDKQSELSAERSGIEQKVVMMRPGSIDRDLLEERASAVLGYRKQGAAVILEQR